MSHPDAGTVGPHPLTTTAADSVAAALRLAQASLSDFYFAFTLLFTMVFGTVAFFRAPNDLQSMMLWIGAAVGCAAFVAAWFAVPAWFIVQAAS